MEKLKELFQEIEKEVTPENVAKLCEVYEILPEGILKDSIKQNLDSMKMITKYPKKGDGNNEIKNVINKRK